MKFLSFDIEISDLFDLQPHEDMDKYAPFHISVAATAIQGGEEKIWYSENHGTPLVNLTKEKAQELLEYLEQKQNEDFAVCAWNGLGFDFKWLGYQADNYELAAKVALNSYDPMFQFFNLAGFPVGLAKVAQAMEITQTKLIDGSEAPIKWRQGEYQLVMDYVLGDCQMTNQVLTAIQQKKKVCWITARQRESYKDMPMIKPVIDVIQDNPPDQSWMDSPIPKEKFYNWIPDQTIDLYR